MWIFFTLVGLGLAFMLYVLVQFHGELKGRRSRRHGALHKYPSKSGGGRPLQINEKGSLRDSGKTRNTGWSHSNGEIRFHSNSNGNVFVQRIRASAKSKFDISG